MPERRPEVEERGKDEVPAREEIPSRQLSPRAREILTKLPGPEAVAVMEDILGKVASNNNANANNNARPGELTRAEMIEKVSELPETSLRAILKAQGII